MAMNKNQLLGLICIVAGCTIIVVVIGELLLRLIIALLGLAVINSGLRLRGLPPLQILVPLMMNRKRWF